jgi:hypothetical protein
MKKSWIAALGVLALSGAAWAHAEPVQVVVVLKPSSGQVQVDVQMVGEVSTLPIRGAVVEARLYPRTPELDALLEEGGEAGLSQAGDPDLPGTPVVRVSLEEPGEGGYRARFPDPGAGDYVLAVVDTTFKGEAAVAAKPVRFPLPPSGATLALELPETSTPNRYLLYALLGLALPALVGVGFALAARGDRKPSD